MALLGSIKITNDKEIDKALKQLEPKVRKKLLKKAMRPAMKPVQAAAKQKAPVRTKALQRSIRIRAQRRSRVSIGINVQTSKSDNLFTGDTYYGGMVEYGTSKMKPRPFMRPAFDSQKDKAKQIAMTELKKLVDEEVKKS